MGADRAQREVAQALLLPAVAASGARIVVCDRGDASRDVDPHAASLGLTITRPARTDEPPAPLRLTSPRQRIESVFFTLKDVLGLERHGAQPHRPARPASPRA